ncbi:MAG TPA: type II secretion system protein [Fimbriimonas sp.]|nr:type II secretion system protein [Fimbriimonas sp.]
MIRRGFTLLELLVYGIILAVASTTVLALVITMGRTQAQATEEPAVQALTQDAITAVAAYVRRAPLCNADEGCTALADSAFQSADSTSLAVFSTSTGTVASFVCRDGALTRTIGRNAIVIIPDSLTMKFQYVLSPSLAYTMGGSTDTLAWQDSVTGSDLKAIMAVKITATVTRDYAKSVQTSIVRLRNSPKKVFTTS